MEKQQNKEEWVKVSIPGEEGILKYAASMYTEIIWLFLLYDWFE